MLANDPELATLRSNYADRSSAERRRAAEWVYDESVSDHLFSTAVARLPGGNSFLPTCPPGFAALAIDPEFAPALLTVGAYEYQHGRLGAGRDLLLRLAELPSDTTDWVDTIDKAADFLIDVKEPETARRLYEEVLKVRPNQSEFIRGIGWVLCRAGRQAEALPWMARAIAVSPEDSEVYSDYGWALTELGCFDEAERILEKAVRLAAPDYQLPANNLARLRHLRQEKYREESRQP